MKTAEIRKQQALFEQVWNDYLPRFSRIANSYANGFDRQDLLQEIGHQIWKSLASFKGDAAIATWAYRVALNTAMTYVRKDTKVPPKEVLSDADIDKADSGIEHSIHLIESFLLELLPLDKAMFLMYLDGFSQQQIAESLALSPSNVGVKISRIKHKFELFYTR